MENTNTIIIAEGMSIEEKLELLNAEKNREAAGKLIASISEDLKAENKETIKTAVETFAHEAARDLSNFFATFLSDPYVTVRRLKESKEDGTFSIVDGIRQVSFAEVDSVYGKENHGMTIAQSKRYVGMIARFTHNLYLNLCGDLSVKTPDGKGKVTVHKYNGQDDVYDFSGYSINKLQEQLNTIVQTIMPEGERIPMVKADVRYLLAVNQKEKNGTRDVTLVTSNEKTIMNRIFKAMGIRKANHAYNVESKAACHKVKESNQTPAQEEQTSKIPERPEAEATLSKKSETEAA